MENVIINLPLGYTMMVSVSHSARKFSPNLWAWCSLYNNSLFFPDELTLLVSSDILLFGQKVMSPGLEKKTKKCRRRRNRWTRRYSKRVWKSWKSFWVRVTLRFIDCLLVLLHTLSLHTQTYRVTHTHTLTVSSSDMKNQFALQMHGGRAQSSPRSFLWH